MTGIMEFAGIWKRREQVYAVPAYYVFKMYTAVAGDSGGAGQFDTSVQYQSAYGTYQAEYHRNGDQNTGMAQASGGLVAMSGDVFPTRPIQDGYALIQVPGVSGVRGFLNNRPVSVKAGIPRFIPGDSGCSAVPQQRPAPPGSPGQTA